MQPDARKYLWDVQDAATFVIQDLQPFTLDEFRNDRRLRSSTLQHLLA